MVVDHNSSTNSHASATFLDGLAFSNLDQLNNVPNDRNRVLDLVFCNKPLSCKVHKAAIPLVPLDSHHPALDIHIACSVPLQFTEDVDTASLDYKRINFTTLNEQLALIDWQNVMTSSNVDEAVAVYNDILVASLQQCTPRIQPVRSPPWSNRWCNKLKSARRRALRKYTNNRNPFTKAAFKKTCAEYKQYVKACYRRYLARIQLDLRRNPKRFWSFVNSKRNEHGLPSVMKNGNENAKTAQEKCNLFARHFSHAFIPPDPNLNPSCAISHVPADLVDIDVPELTEEQIVRAASKLKVSFNPGPNGVPANVLKKCINILKRPLVHIFNLSLAAGEFPSAWKSSDVFPVFKKGNKQEIEDYRGITSLCAESKLFEITINEYLFFHCRNYIHPAQHGFYAGRSVSTNLLDFTSFCIRNIEKGAQVDVVYTDLKAAFDRVDHDILLAKLRRLGFSTRLMRWLESYLKNRKMCVKIGSYRSDFFCNTSGVPQGSNLGPLLFSLFINDVCTILANGGLLLYADDLKIYLIVRSEEDCRRLQDLLDLFSEWSTNNRMRVSVAKCAVMSFYRKKEPLQYVYSLFGVPVKRVSTIIDLGVELDTELTFHSHHASIIRRANRQLGFIFKIGEGFDDPHCLLSLYCALVRSILESASSVWCPYHRSWINRIENVQRKFVRCALRNLPWNDRLHLPPYENRCMLLGIQTLETRRNVAKAVLAAKIVRSEIDCPTLLPLINFNVPPRRLRNPTILRLERRRTDYGKWEPIRSICRSFIEYADLFDFDRNSDYFKRQILLALSSIH